jgi:hypothetical protein
MTVEEKKRVAQLRLRARRHRSGELRRRSILLSLAVFALLWGALFAQMVSGHDPVLGSGTQVASARGSATAHPTKQRSRSADDGSQLALDPETGAIVEVPSGSGSAGGQQAAPATQAPTPAPVVTAQS